MGVYSHALESAQILDNNNYFLATGYVPVTATAVNSQLVELLSHLADDGYVHASGPVAS